MLPSQLAVCHVLRMDECHSTFILGVSVFYEQVNLPPIPIDYDPCLVGVGVILWIDQFDFGSRKADYGENLLFSNPAMPTEPLIWLLAKHNKPVGHSTFILEEINRKGLP